ncbi:MAG: sn-glycerol-3-phosphate ABC transporter ATP-binding protein UgpC [Bacilli bacterium]|nr:sn-glycerol-3-phosphate ABC transporter ATP-binding protein UgpC [Bacilli bacterium]
MPKLKLENINKIYPNGFQAVYDFNLEIEDGEFVILVGPSGCGKSTTLRMIAGLEDISSGRFLVDGKEANVFSPKERGVAMVFQSYALYPHLDVYGNLSFGLELQGFDPDLIEDKVLKIAKILGLSEYLKRKPRELSGGQRQRVAVGRAIIRKADIFLMDEPLSNLDAKHRVSMRSEIVDLHRKVGSTTIYVTHDQVEAMTMADRIVIMKDGYIQAVGTPKELYFRPANAFVAGFIGEPPMNFIDSRIENNNLLFTKAKVKLDILEAFPVAKTYQDIVLGFRPEAILLGHLPEKKMIHLEAKVELTELLGDSTNVYVNIGEHNIILKVEPYAAPKVGSSCKFSVPYEAIYLFDNKTGTTLNL